jgi:predicted membrane GTPase involved in stress response
MQMSLEEAIGYVAADELIEASFLYLLLMILLVLV